MSVKLDQAEIDDFLSNGHTIILSTIRQSGEPFSVPMWYVYLDGAIYIRTLAKAAKVKHLRRDPRACCLVETGEKWIDLKAVVANCDAEIIEEAEILERVGAALAEKYAAFRPDTGKQPKATRAHYGSGWVVLKLTPRDVRSWDNRKIRMAS